MRKTWAVAVAVLLSTLLAVPAPAFDDGLTPVVAVPRVFSPNGDGVKDKAPVRFLLPRKAKVSISVEATWRHAGMKRVRRTVRLGRLPAGKHVWRWDGRDNAGLPAPEGEYWVHLQTDVAKWRIGHVPTRVDRSFRATLTPRRYGGQPNQLMAVYPRSTEVLDSLDLTASVERFRRARLVIRDSLGRMVFRQEIVGHKPTEQTIAWTARLDDQPLPPGMYKARVRGVDKWGNRGSTPVVPMEVSDRPLVMHERTFEVTAAGSRVHHCYLTPVGYWCGPVPPGVVPSEIYPEGLSHRSFEGPYGDVPATSRHYLGFPETVGVRGIEQARVMFFGRPTVDGEDDLGHLVVWTTPWHGWSSSAPPEALASSSSVGQTGWIEPFFGEGIDQHSVPLGQVPDYRTLQADPGVGWSFRTTGQDSFDVERFTVDVRYLAPAS
jgi:hypothetical protein